MRAAHEPSPTPRKTCPICTARGALHNGGSAPCLKGAALEGSTADSRRKAIPGHLVRSPPSTCARSLRNSAPELGSFPSAVVDSRTVPAMVTQWKKIPKSRSKNLKKESCLLQHALHFFKNCEQLFRIFPHCGTAVREFAAGSALVSCRAATIEVLSRSSSGVLERTFGETWLGP